MRIAWDDAKHRANRRKHGVSFDAASELFRSGVDDLEIFDAEHSTTEDRDTTRPGGRDLDGTGGDAIRIITARWATKHAASI